MHANNPFATPQAPDLGTPPISDNKPGNGQEYFAVGTTKLVVMTLVTFGLYTIHWFERQYRFQKVLRNESTMPLARGFFSIFFVHELMRRVTTSAATTGARANWTVSNLAGIFIASAIAGRVLDKATEHVGNGAVNVVLALVGLGLIYGLAYPLAKVQETINEILERKNPRFVRNDGFTAWNWILIVLGSGLFLLGLVGLFLGDAVN